MTDYTIIDRRINPKGKNLSNRQRFLQRTREWVKAKVRQSANDRSITSGDGEEITIDAGDISEPSFDYDYHSGDWDRILPGNKEYTTGDRIKRPPSGKSKGAGTDSDPGEDDFVFSISKEEYLDILFEDLELPALVKESEEAAISFSRKRSGFSTSGTPNNLDLEKSLKNALGRRIALAFPLDRRIKEKEKEIELETDEIILSHLKDELATLIRRRLAITYIDQVDVRYKRFNNVPLPMAQAVVFCLMDVSGSMGDLEKEIAKRFFLLLYLFLQRKYQKVDIRFVRHHTEADECTEQQFFYDKKSGGTVVSTGIKKVNEIISADYPLDLWNIYVVQASDGDNDSQDNLRVKDEMATLLPKCQYYVYNEVKPATITGFMGMVNNNKTNVYETMSEISEDYDNLMIVNVGTVEEVVPMFRKVFTKGVSNGK